MIFIVEILVIVVTVLIVVVSRIKWQQKYWERKGVFTLKSNFPFGNFGNPFSRTKHMGIIVQSIYNEIKQMQSKHGGVYMLTSPVYVPIDPNILKNVLLKDFQYFHDRGFYHNEKDDPLSANLFAISGSKWRSLRTKLTPTFTSGKMKMMFNKMVECAENMRTVIQQYERSTDGIEIKEILARYTTDVIGSCAFGLECSSFESENNEFRKYGKIIFNPISKFKSFLNTFAFANPDLARRLGIKLFTKQVNEFFIKVVRDTIKYREEKRVNRNDMLQILMELVDHEGNADEKKHYVKALSVEEIAAQAFVFFVAGFDTSSSTMAFCLYELALNSNLQLKVRSEINCVLNKYDGSITYEAIMDMKYLQQVIDETLRKYPPLSYLSRRCVEDYKIPETDILIEQGTKLYISLLGLHYDPEYFSNPEEFNPERFSEENRSKIQPFTYLPFGEGPRACIGLRFGLLQTKIGLVALLRDHKISLNNKTVLPFNIDRYNFIVTPKDGIWLNIESV